MIKYIKSDNELLYEAHIIEDELERVVGCARKALDATADYVDLLKQDFDNPTDC